jgi:hypothetical protein
MSSTSELWHVFLLFTIPIGGGIPAGVILAKSYGYTWVMMTFLYFLSDVALALVFEQLIEIFIWAGRHYPRFGRVNAAVKDSIHKTVSKYEVRPGPIMLVMIAFGTDPMTGRGVTRFLGHGFFWGWTLTILGDLIFFELILVSTLMLNNLLGDGTLTSVIILVLMFMFPMIIRKFSALKAHLTTRKT